MWLFKDGKSEYIKDSDIKLDVLVKVTEKYFEDNKTITSNVVAGNTTVSVSNDRIPTWEEYLVHLGFNKRLIDSWAAIDNLKDVYDFLMSVKDYICGKQIGSYVNNKGNASGLKFSAINNFGYKDKSIVENTGTVELVVRIAENK